MLSPSLPTSSRDFLFPSPSPRHDGSCRHTALRCRGLVIPNWMRYPGIPGRGIPFATLAWTPHRVRGDFRVIPRHDAVSRNTRKITHKIHFPLRPGAGPRIGCGVTRYVHSSQQREERTKKRRRCYRASSLGGWHHPRGLWNSLRSNSPRPPSSVGWPPPGPIKAGFCFALTARLHLMWLRSYRTTMRYPEIPAKLPAKYIFLCDTCLDPASPCGVTRCASGAGVSSQRGDSLFLSPGHGGAGRATEICSRTT